MRERVLVIGSGAREHALAYKLSDGSKRQVFVLGGNAGIAQEFECISPNEQNIGSMILAAKRLAPDLVVIGPENLLAEGLSDALEISGFNVFGPSQKASLLEVSKFFTKDICKRAYVNTAAFWKFDDYETALSFVNRYQHDEMVIKIDGLCAGKGVAVCRDKKDAISTLDALFKNDGFSSFGIRDQTIVIEEFLDGSEVSVFGAANGRDVALFCPMQDYKRLLNFDDGPNTGGMGSIGPLGRDCEQRASFLERIKDQIFLPVLLEMEKQGRPFHGLLYAGLMLTRNGVRLLEFNVRFGDPETQSLLFGTPVDIYPLLFGIAKRAPMDMDYWQSELLLMKPAATIVLASAGYPKNQSEKVPLMIPQQSNQDTKLFFAATGHEKAELMAASGRVLNVVGRGPTIEAACALGYELVRKIEFVGMQYRSDIGTNVTELNIV